MDVAFVLLVNQLSNTRFGAAMGIAMLVYSLWYSEEKETEYRIRRLEEEMAKRSGDEEEDFYIKSLYQPSTHLFSEFFLRKEWLFWFTLMMLILAGRGFIEMF
jgi:hypothetical protein